MKIGIPKALLYYYYYPFFKTLFTELGHEVVLSDITNKKIMTQGSNVTVSELCVPIKIFNGHVCNLMEKDVDYIFLPRFYQMGKEWYCPKFLGITEIAENSVDGLKEKVLEMNITSDDQYIDKLSDYEPIMKKIGVSKSDMKRALAAAKKAFCEYRSNCKNGYTINEAFDIFDGKKIKKWDEEAEITIGLLGYVNNIYDNFVSMNAIQKLRDMNVRVITFDMLPDIIIDEHKKGKQPFWVFARKIYNSASYLLENQMVDGIIHLTAFCCGPDSVIGKLMELDSDKANIPFMTLRVDEHTGEGHVQTRLEAFVDMLKIKKSKERAAMLK